MLEYDLTDSRLFASQENAKPPSDAEMFVLTASLLLVYEAAYSDLIDGEMALTESNADAVVECIEERLPEFERDLGVQAVLRKRIQAFVGLRIRCVTPAGMPPKPN